MKTMSHFFYMCNIKVGYIKNIEKIEENVEKILYYNR